VFEGEIDDGIAKESCELEEVTRGVENSTSDDDGMVYRSPRVGERMCRAGGDDVDYVRPYRHGWGKKNETH
jgi:hypothetical protein